MAQAKSQLYPDLELPDWVKILKRKKLPILKIAFEDFGRDVAFNSSGRYKATYLKPSDYKPHINLITFLSHVQKLRERYPQHSYRLTIVICEGKEFWVLKRGSTKCGNYKEPSLWYDPETKTFYVPQSYVEYDDKLCTWASYVNMSNLGVYFKQIRVK